MADELCRLILRVVERYRLVEPGQRVLVAVSGGQDSVALLHALASLGEVFPLVLTVAHLNHCIRGAEADRDECLTRELAEALGLECVTERQDVPRLAREQRLCLEVAARRARYAFLERLAAAGHDRVALGHTASDRAESALMNILRGAGLEGLRGMPAHRGVFIRPLIEATRGQTAAYCARHGLSYAVDSTNLDPSASQRNRIRLELLPHLEREYGPGAQAALGRLAQAAEEELEWTEPLVESALAAARGEDGRALALPALAQMPRGLRRRVMLRALAERGADLRSLTQAHCDAIERLAVSGRAGAVVQLPGYVWLVRGYNEIEMSTQPPQPAPSGAGAEVVRALNVPGVTLVPELGARFSSRSPEPDEELRRGRHCVDLDADALVLPLSVRTWRPGDRMRPLGLGGSKKLQDLFGDAKTPRAARSLTPVIVDAGGEIIWVVGHAVAHDARVTASTTHRIQIEVQFLGPPNEAAPVAAGRHDPAHEPTTA